MVVEKMSDAEVDRLFHALADATRRDIVRQVLVAEQSISSLARRYDMSMTAVQKHVGVLEEAGLIAKHRHGREQRIACQGEAFNERRRCLTSSSNCGGNASTDSATCSPNLRRREVMSVISVNKDPGQLTMTITAEYDVPAERAWELWSDPRQLERWWGPPTYPATFVDHDFTPGGAVTYYMTGPRATSIGAGGASSRSNRRDSLVLEDGFADENGQPDAGMPTVLMRMSLQDRDSGGVVMTMETTFPSLESMEQMVAMGMEEGITAAMGQIDGILTEGVPA